MDRRQQKTRAAIYQAFMDLLGNKHYANITIQDIIDQANIGRSTFYAHFETKEDLLDAFCKHLFGQIVTERPVEGGFVEHVGKILANVRENWAALRGILNCESGEVFLSYFKTLLVLALDGYVHETDVPRDLLLRQGAATLAETVRWWTLHEDVSREDALRFFLETLPWYGEGWRKGNGEIAEVLDEETF